ncbi:MAG: CbiM family transporter [Fimbriiglobus sp.]|nr:CbiM family transporter [Fimbriiglobus sp.]
MPPFAVHIGPGLLAPEWVLSGFVHLAVVVLLSLWKVSERDVPRIGVLTAAFFVASSVHLPLGGASVHLLLNGLVGVILRWRAGLAVAVGLTLQTFLLGHGGPDALGVNFAVLTLPAFLAGATFRPLFRVLPAFAAGVLVGGGTAALTVLLHAVVLYFGVSLPDAKPREWVAGVGLVANLPVIAAEAIGVGFACRVLAKAKPEWLGLSVGAVEGPINVRISENDEHPDSRRDAEQPRAEHHPQTRREVAEKAEGDSAGHGQPAEDAPADHQPARPLAE